MATVQKRSWALFMPVAGDMKAGAEATGDRLAAQIMLWPTRFTQQSAIHGPLEVQPLDDLRRRA